jgi:cellulose synthase/poly-beta-1,6-N-acetylglucosamine synthase-like glycosyltransferase
MEKYPPVSIIVPAYNAQETIDGCLKSLLDLDYPEKEIIVINDASTDKTSEIAAGYEGVAVIDVENGGAARATNIGIGKAKHDIIISVDSDAELEKGWLKKIIPEFEDEGVGAVGGYPVTANKKIWGKLMGYEVEDRFNRSGKYVDQLYTMNTAYRRNVLEEVGFFNESLRVGYDNDMSYKVTDLGYKIVLVKDAKCYHYWRESLKGYAKQQYNSAYFRLVLVRRFKKPSDNISGGKMMVQVPITFICVVLAPLYPILFAIPFLIQIPITARLLLSKKDLVLLVMPFLFYFRNVVWVFAAIKWGIDSLNPFK